MDHVLILIVLVTLGLCFGSFVNALVWRLRHRRNFVSERSECTHCHHVLEWYDLVPVVSWTMLRGKCRYCHKKIDDSPLVELITSGLFVLSYSAWPFGFETVGIWMFVLWLICIVALVALAVYDMRWQLLPDKIVLPLGIIGVILGFLRFYVHDDLGLLATIVQMAGGVAVISGLYFVLHYMSRGAWVGFGDVKLNVFIGLILGWQSALLAVFLANILGLLVVLPGLLLKKITPKSRIPFGPFLIAACIIALLWGQQIINWYTTTLLGL